MDELEAKNIYNKIAESYHNNRSNNNFYNEMVEMPATLELLGEIKNKKVLDFGCGTGIYPKILSERGAQVSGFDISEEMLKIAQENNPELDLRHGSGYNIPFSEKFDIVVASLVMGYIEDWDDVFKEIRRVLKKDGYFVFSIGNPVAQCARKKEINGKKIKVLGEEDYFEEKKIEYNWENGEKVQLYHKTYETIIKTIIKQKFEIIDYKDCPPIEESKEIFPEEYEKIRKYPHYCVWKIKKRT